MLITPRLQIFYGSVDAKNDVEFKFDIIGGDRVYANEIEIYDTSTNERLYTKKVTSYILSQIVPRNTITNGAKCKIRIRVFDRNDSFSYWSDYIYLKFSSTPSVVFIDLPTEFITSGTYTFKGEYNQAEGESASRYVFNIYDENKILIKSSGSLSDGLIEYTINWLEPDVKYFIEFTVTSESGGFSKTDEQSIIVKYIINEFGKILQTENNFEKASMDLKVKVISARFESNENKYVFLDGGLIDLTGTEVHTNNELGFSLNSDKWTMNIRFKKALKDVEIFKLIGIDLDYLTIEQYKTRLFIRYYYKDVLMSNKWINIENILKEDIVHLLIQKNENIIDAKWRRNLNE